MNNELLSLIKLINESDYKNRPGYFMPHAAKIKFSFTSKDYVASLKAYKNTRTINEHLKIIIHEYFHFFQRFYTTHGYYNQLIEQFKIAVTVNISKCLIDSNYKINAPLISIIESSPSLVNNNYITRLLFNWLDADIIYSYINYDFIEYYQKYELANKIRVDFPIIYNKFLTFEKYLFEYLQFSSRVKGIPSEIFSFDVHNTRFIIKSEEINATNKILNIFPSLNGVIESYSKASELYLDCKNFNMNDFKKMVVPAEKTDYYVPLLLGLQFIHTNTPTEFLLTYLAICDIALSPPILPNLAQLRNNNSSIDNIDPCYRFYVLLNSQSNIRPAKNLDEDYYRYINEICSLLNWTTPNKIAEKFISTFQLVEGDLTSYIFYNSQKIRLLNSLPYFLDVESFLIYLSDNLVHCPVTEFSDDVFINHGFDNVIGFVETYFELEYLNRQFWMNILTKMPNKLYLPYQTEDWAIKNHSNMFYQVYSEQFGINLKSIKIINPPI